MAEKSIIVIGAGLAGLSAGCYGRMNGYRTRIFEHDAEPGGVARAWRHGDYLIDGGIHYLMGHHPGQACYKLYQELGILQNRRYPDLTTFLRFTDELTGARVSFTSDLAAVARDLKQLAPEDTATIDRFIAGAQAMRRADLFKLMETPPALMGMFGPVKQMWGMRQVLRYFGPEFNQPMEKYVRPIKSEALRRLLVNLFLPEVPVWFVLLLLGLLANRQLGLLEQSCADFVASLTDRFHGLGGELTCSASVKEILVRDDRAVGVRLADGTEHHADVVIGAGDARRTIFELLGGRYVDASTRQRFDRWRTLCPIITLSLGVAREFPDDPPLNYLLLKSPLLIGDVSLDGFPIRYFNYGRGFSPAGRTVVQVLLHADWKYWNDLRADRPRYEAEKQRVVADVLARLEPHIPGITGQVELTDVGTPYTTWRYTLNHEGSFMGWSPTPEAMRSRVSNTLSGLANFYMAGQWVMPGGGVPPCLFSGRHVIQLLCRRDRKPFAASFPV